MRLAGACAGRAGHASPDRVGTGPGEVFGGEVRRQDLNHRIVSRPRPRSRGAALDCRSRNASRRAPRSPSSTFACSVSMRPIRATINPPDGWRAGSSTRQATPRLRCCAQYGRGRCSLGRHDRRRSHGRHTIDTGTNDLLAALDDGVLTLTLNRPEARNAMSRAMNDALADPAGRGRARPRGEVHRADRRRQGLLRRRRREGHGGTRRRHGRRQHDRRGDPPPAGQPARHRRQAVQDAQADARRACPAPRPARAWRWRWPATCGSWPAPPS